MVNNRTSVLLNDSERRLLFSVVYSVLPAADLSEQQKALLERNIQDIVREKPHLGEGLKRILNALSLDPLVRALGGFYALALENRKALLYDTQELMPKHFHNLVELCKLSYSRI